MGIGNIVTLLTGVALFLFGMSLMGAGLKSVAGSKLELILYRLTSTPLKGVFLGTGVTAVIQSSSATSVMVVGFVNSGMMKVKQATGIILGALLGTSITGWIICLSEVGGSGADGWIELFSTATLTCVVALVGVSMRMFTRKQLNHHVGDILMGFAVLMFGISTMSGAVAPLKESPAFQEFLIKFSNPLLLFAVGLLVTAVLQSASAAVGILQALAISGAISFSVTVPIILGIAVGASVPVLLSALGANTNGRRTAFIYLFANLFGSIICGSAFYIVRAAAGLDFDPVMTSVSVALVNTVFRLIIVLILFPFVGLIEKLVVLLFPGKADEAEDNADIDRLEDRFIEHPALAVEQSRLAIHSMANKAKKNLGRAMELLWNYDEDAFDLIQEKEDVIDRYEDKLGTYLVKLTGKELSHDQNKDVSQFLHTVGDFERIGDHAANLSKVAREIHEKKLEFSFEAKREMQVLASAVTEIVAVSVDAFTKSDLGEAYKVEPLEELIDNLCDEVKLNHVRRVQTGNCTLNQGFVYSDMLTNFERIADHCSNIAVAMIELQVDSFDTHEYLNSVKKMKSGSFNLYFEEYSKKYRLQE